MPPMNLGNVQQSSSTQWIRMAMRELASMSSSNSSFKTDTTGSTAIFSVVWTAMEMGSLDFSEVLTFYYILKTRGVWCDYCGICLMGLYFTCVACFDNASARGNTYDLCSTCYEAQRHQQQHSHHDYFLDSYVLLRAKAGLPLLAGAPDLHQRMQIAFQALEIALKVREFATQAAQAIGSGCSIM
ncbi:hypothetical protein SO802_026654 [Lithocarpus litseifolius]|uniref:ZZ-type domain-containing protein n=1 Tax=Lithocarpus litseifolius TaxID=425828 RepID=A0AAW2C3V8_9ROSI